jgi:hypothetical protein
MREEIVRRPCQQTAGAAWGETCPISTEGWTRRVHFVREGGGGGGSRTVGSAAPASRAIHHPAH